MKSQIFNLIYFNVNCICIRGHLYMTSLIFCHSLMQYEPAVSNFNEVNALFSLIKALVTLNDFKLNILIKRHLDRIIFFHPIFFCICINWKFQFVDNSVSHMSVDTISLYRFWKTITIFWQKKLSFCHKCFIFIS